MKTKLKRLIRRYDEQWRYLIVGVCTTVINYVIYFAFNALGLYYIASNILAWVGAVAFAYFANGSWVYRSTAHRGLREAVAFVMSRVFSLGVETALLFVMVELLAIGQNWAKIVVAVVVVVLNYLTGLLVYKRKRP